MEDPLKDLPRLRDEALGPCALCKRVMLGTETPIFYRFTVQHCVIDQEAVRRHVGLAQTFGGGANGLALASVMGPGVKPVVVMQSGEINLCMRCSQEHADLTQLAWAALETGE